jgi:ParB-like chromosome segregation protein Spo0J
MKVRDRVKDFRRVKASELRPSPLNWRTHPPAQRDALQGLLAEVGFAGACLARELPDGSLELIDGHLRAETTPDMELPVVVLDVTEAEARKLLAAYDPIGAMAQPDAARLDAVLKEVQTGSQALAQMLTDLAGEAGILTAPSGEGGRVDPAEVYQGMPECEQQAPGARHTIYVHFETPEDMQDFGRLIGQEVTEKTRWLWHPRKEKAAEKEFIVEDGQP